MRIIFQGVKKLMEKVKLNQFGRNDGFNPSNETGCSIQEKWIHKPVVVKTGDGEDDFIIEEKAVMIDSIDIHKSIQEEAKTTDLEYLLKQLMQTGDESILNKRVGFYGDVSMFEEDHSLNKKNIDLESIKEKLPEEFRKLSDEELAKLSDEDIINYYQSKIDEVKAKTEKEVKSEEVVEEKGEK